jgi:hypothetical protein
MFRIFRLSSGASDGSFQAFPPRAALVLPFRMEGFFSVAHFWTVAFQPGETLQLYPNELYVAEP